MIRSRIYLTATYPRQRGSAVIIAGGEAMGLAESYARIKTAYLRCAGMAVLGGVNLLSLWWPFAAPTDFIRILIKVGPVLALIWCARRLPYLRCCVTIVARKNAILSVDENTHIKRPHGLMWQSNRGLLNEQRQPTKTQTIRRPHRRCGVGHLCAALPVATGSAGGRHGLVCDFSG